jgi:hypothetical protein
MSFERAMERDLERSEKDPETGRGQFLIAGYLIIILSPKLSLNPKL